MKKRLSIRLILALLTGLFVIPAGAAEPEFQYYDAFKAQYCGDGQDASVYEELYNHQTGGATDWALVRADFGWRAEVVTQRVVFGRAIAANDCASPFEFTYGIYDVSRQRFFDLYELQNEADYPDLQEVFDRFGVGQRITAPQLGDNLRYYESFKNQFVYDESHVKRYDELFAHETGGKVDWALIQAETFFKLPCGGTYSVVGDRVFRTEGICQPFGNLYAVYYPALDRFYPFGEALVNPQTQIGKKTPGLQAVINELNLGERIGDLDGDGKIAVNDATVAQRCLAEYQDFPDNDAVGAAGYENQGGSDVAYLSDVNGDGTRDVRDVTATQRLLAQMN